MKVPVSIRRIVRKWKEGEGKFSKDEEGWIYFWSYDKGTFPAMVVRMWEPREFLKKKSIKETVKKIFKVRQLDT